MTTSPPLAGLIDALVDVSPVLDDRSAKLALGVYRSLAKGSPVPESSLVEETGLPNDYVAETLSSWPGVFRDEGHIVGFWGLALPEMPHALEINGVRLHAWCAWDTLFLPEILRGTAHVRSRDPRSGEQVALTVAPEGVQERSHDDVVVSFLVPSDRWDNDVITSFCHYVHFFTDPESAGLWTGSHPGTFVLSVDDALMVGRRWNRARGLVRDSQ